MKYFVYLALHHLSYVREAINSIWSLYRVWDQTEECNILIYTNMMNDFSSLPPQTDNFNYIFKEVSENSELADKTYVYRSKIISLILFIKEYKSKVIFIDTDTFFLKSPYCLFDKITPTNTIMNYQEHILKETVNGPRRSNSRLSYDVYYKENLDIKTACFSVKKDTPLWNSGVIGVEPSHLSWLQDSLSASDFIWNYYHLRTAEQFAIACVFQHYGTIESADRYVFHYWFAKKIEDLLNTAFVQESKYSADKLAEQILNLPNVKKRKSLLLNVISKDSYMGLLLSLK